MDTFAFTGNNYESSLFFPVPFPILFVETLLRAFLMDSRASFILPAFSG